MSDPNLTERLKALLAELPCNKVRPVVLAPAREALVRAVEETRDSYIQNLDRLAIDYSEFEEDAFLGERRRAEATFDAVLQVLVGVETPPGCTCGEAYGSRAAATPRCGYCRVGARE